MQRSLFDDTHDDFRESVRGFLLREAVPRREEWEQAGIIDRHFWKRAAAQGYVGFSAPEEFGGAGIRDFRFNAVVDEEVVGTGTVGDGEVLLEVEDHGVGIPARDLDRIFERFYRVDQGRSRTTGGTGLGLAIVRQLVELMGGDLGLDSEVDRGSTFWFELPVVAPS